MSERDSTENEPWDVFGLFPSSDSFLRLVTSLHLSFLYLRIQNTHSLLLSQQPKAYMSLSHLHLLKSYQNRFGYHSYFM